MGKRAGIKKLTAKNVRNMKEILRQVTVVTNFCHLIRTLRIAAQQSRNLTVRKGPSSLVAVLSHNSFQKIHIHLSKHFQVFTLV